MMFHESVFCGKQLRLSVSGASHASRIGMRLSGFTAGFPVDESRLASFMERRAPGRDALSTSRREPDKVLFTKGVRDGATDGDEICAVIKNVNYRPGDYGSFNTVPRPGHADYPMWIKTGRIPSGGGAHSGRMTASMCIAGGICMQWLGARGIEISARVIEIGGSAEVMEERILSAKQDGDSVGGIIEAVVTGLPPGLGGPMFDGIESRLSAALFGIPGVKGIEFGAGFAAAGMRGSENNDAFEIVDGTVRTVGNNHGGLLGGMTSGMPLRLRLAMKPTPSIFKEQRSVDLETGDNVSFTVKGRHDPCIALRAVPVVEALCALALADELMFDECSRPRICLTLTAATIDENLQTLRRERAFVDMAELRADALDESEWRMLSGFPAAAGVPVILTVRRKCDGGFADLSDALRKDIFKSALTGGGRYAFVDFEEDFHDDELERLARGAGCTIIRSVHKFDGRICNVREKLFALKGDGDEMPKLAFKVDSAAETADVFAELSEPPPFPYIVCAMGRIGCATRILAQRTGSFLTFVSPSSADGSMKQIGHLTAREIVRTYRFRSVTKNTALYAVTGWPLEHTSSPEINNAAFAAEGLDAVMVPLPAETAEEAMNFAERLNLRAMAVTVPHKEAIIGSLTEVDEAARRLGAVNTVVRTGGGWKGFNTDVTGFASAISAFCGSENLNGVKVSLIGAGGAAKAVAFALDRLGAKVCVFNRTLERARELALRYGFDFAFFDATAQERLRQYSDLIVQSTSVGLGSTNPDDDPIAFYRFGGHEMVYDLIYSPELTPLLKRAKSAGCKVENGFSMLLAQAADQRAIYQNCCGE